VKPPIELIANPDAVIADLVAADGAEATRTLHARLAATPGAVGDAPLLLEGLMERAALASVCIADDVAMPHARTPAVERLVLAVGRAPGGLAFDPAHPRVRLVFLAGTPKDAVGEYLQFVAALSRLLKNAATRQALIAAPGEAELRAVLARGAKR
jgi:mannitol/fructose-specific phosphotransferase system IIA component (Ntr-type)